jgi:transcription initiation factor TFIIF subunit alpha
MSASNSSNSAIRSRLLDKTLSIDRKAAAAERTTGRPKMRTVVTASRQGDDDDELRGRSKGKSRDKDQEMEDDEFEYEEDFQDDEEGVATIDDLADEQETKELEVSLVEAAWTWTESDSPSVS